MRSDSLEHSECVSNQNRHFQCVVEFEYFRLGSHIPSGADDLLFKCGQFWIASHAPADKYGVDPLGSQSFTEFV